MRLAFPVLSHIALGSTAILLYWVALASVKGGPRHRAAGKAFFITLALVALSVAPLLLLRPGPFDPAWVVQFVYLTICLLTVAMLGWTSIRWKNDLARFRGTHFKVLSVVLFVLGSIVLAVGVVQQAPLTISFSWVGLVYGGGMMRFAWMRAEPHPRWAIIWHLNAVCGLFNAAHGTFLAVTWRLVIDSSASSDLGAAMQVLTVLVALGLRLWFGVKRGAPLRLTRTSSERAAAGAA